MRIKTETVIRTVLTAVTLINTVLVIVGRVPLPWADEEIYSGLSAFLAFCTTLWSWWKNNSFTQAAIKADLIMEEIKNENNTSKL